MKFLNEELAAAGNRDHVACFENCVRVGFDDPTIAPYPLDEDTPVRQQVADRLAQHVAPGLDPVRSEVEPPVGRQNARLAANRSAAHLALVVGAGLDEIHADEPRAEL